MIEPPESLSPRELFELLCARRPSVGFEWLEQPLTARALTVTEWADVRRDRRYLLIHAVMSCGRQVFDGVETLGELDADDTALLFAEVTKAIDVCGPTYARCDATKWHQRLLQGAAESGPLRYSLASCVDVGMSSVVPRPDRFWGLPLADLTDGHWMAYYAAREQEQKSKA